MINIAVYANQTLFLSHITELIKNFLVEQNVIFQISSFNDPTDLLSQSLTYYQLFILDISLANLSEIELALNIRKRHKNANIIFVSALEHSVFSAIKAQPFRFVRKRFLLEELIEALTAFLDISSSSPIYISIISCGLEKKIDTSTIYYIESDKHYLNVYTFNDSLRTRAKLEELLPLLPSQFFTRINQSYIVNMQHIQEYSGNTVILANMTTLSIGRKYKNNFKKALANFPYK